MAKKTTAPKKSKPAAKAKETTPHTVTTKTAKMDVDDESLKKAGEAVKQ